MEQKGLVHLYTGDGKGKTTAAVGLTVRAAGRGKRVVFCQFLKNNQTGELKVLQRLEEVTVITDYPVQGFTRSMTPQQLEQTRTEQQEKWKKATALAVEQKASVLVLDELMAAIGGGFVPLDWVVSFLQQRPDHLEVVMTGRNPPMELIECCDYHSEIQARRHPYEKGILAREGIEY